MYIINMKIYGRYIIILTISNQIWQSLLQFWEALTWNIYSCMLLEDNNQLEDHNQKLEEQICTVNEDAPIQLRVSS